MINGLPSTTLNLIPQILPGTVNGGGLFSTTTRSVLDDTAYFPALFARSHFLPVQPVRAARFGSTFLAWSRLSAHNAFATTDNMPDESRPSRRRDGAENPDSRDAPGDTGRTGPNHRTPNWDSPGSGSGWEPGMGGSGSGNEPI